MIQNINKVKLITIVLFSILNLSCKSNSDEKSESINNDSEVVLDAKLSEVSSEPESNNSEQENYFFYNAYFQSGGETDLAEISEEEVIEKFKKIKISLSTNTISIDGIKSSYTIDEKDSKKFFDKKYIYDYNVDVYKNFFNIDISNKVNFLNLDIENNYLSPFQDYFLEGGDAIFNNGCLFLNYKRFIVCFKKQDKNKVWDKKYCELPFDYERLDRSCQRDSKSRYPELCSNEYPIFYFKNDPKLKSIIQDKIKNKNLLHYYNIKTTFKDINLMVVVCEHEEESYGDQYIVALKDNSVSILSDEENEFFHSMNFIINKDLTVAFYENNGIHPKGKIVNVYKISNDGSFNKVK